MERYNRTESAGTLKFWNKEQKETKIFHRGEPRSGVTSKQITVWNCFGTDLEWEWCLLSEGLLNYRTRNLTGNDFAVCDYC